MIRIIIAMIVFFSLFKIRRGTHFSLPLYDDYVLVGKFGNIRDVHTCLVRFDKYRFEKDATLLSCLFVTRPATERFDRGLFFVLFLRVENFVFLWHDSDWYGIQSKEERPTLFIR